MPLSILSSTDRRAYTDFPPAIDEYALARYFTLTAQDQKAVSRCRGDHNRLGLASQLSWLRWLGWQPEHTQGAPEVGTNFLAHQLNVSAGQLAHYPDHPRTWWLHAEQVRVHLGWRAYQGAEAKSLTTGLVDEALQYDHGRGLLEAALSYLRREKIVRPAITTIERVVRLARGQAQMRLEALMNEHLTPVLKDAVDALIAPVRSGGTSPLQFLKDPPGKPTARSLLNLLDKIDKLRALGVDTLDLSALNPNRRKALAREARRLFPMDFRRLEAPRSQKGRILSPGTPASFSGFRPAPIFSISVCPRRIEAAVTWPA